jgi:hypothetical protein
LAANVVRISPLEYSDVTAITANAMAASCPKYMPNRLNITTSSSPSPGPAPSVSVVPQTSIAISTVSRRRPASDQPVLRTERSFVHSALIARLM